MKMVLITLMMMLPSSHIIPILQLSALRPFWDSFGTIFRLLWGNSETTFGQVLDNFETTFGLLWDNSETTFGQLRIDFRTSLRKLWDNFWTTSKRFWDYFETTLRQLWDTFEKEFGTTLRQPLYQMVTTSKWLSAEQLIKKERKRGLNETVS